ncbi:hypothetical protein BT93_B1303 [Corymbia citriodora subsp. variegata]|nr:hypothetical protein BT93_B1303 [Corymbia citriodora subsp. variegata]
MTLQEAIAADDVNELYSLIEQDENLLDHGSKGPFPDTPLHDAADKGKTTMAMEIATLKPSFAQKLNRGGHSPIHLALQKKHYHTVRALMTLDPKLIRVRGRGGITPLHFVAREIGDNEQDNVELLELLVKFLYACKSSIEDLTNQCETAVHVSIKAGNIEAFKVLFEWLKQVHLTEVLDWKDQDGDTVLHIAESKKQPEIIKLLSQYADVNAKNFLGKTALEISEVNPSGSPDVADSRHEGRRERRYTPTLSLSQFSGREPTDSEKSANTFSVQDKSNRDIIVVVSTLIAAATYQAALTPPGGYWQDSSSNSTVVTANSSSVALGKPHQAGDIIMSGSRLFIYTFCNSVAFFASIATISATALHLKACTFMVYFCLAILCTAYYISMTIQIPETDEAARFSVSLLFSLSLFAMSCLPICTVYKRAMRTLVRPRVDATRRHSATFPG